MTIRLLLASWLGASLLVALPCRADQAEQVAELVRPLIEKEAIVGCVVGVFDRGQKQVYAFGEVARGGGQTPDGATIYEIGSITKAFTGTLLADMALRGEVSLDAPISDLMPQGTKPPEINYRPITLADLAAHTSGLPRLPANFAPADPANPYADYDTTRMYAFLAGYKPPSPPGEYKYSNFGAGLLGSLLAHRAGKSYEQLIAERITKPLAMSDTKIELSPADRGRLAPPYDSSLQPAKNWDHTATAGAGGIYSTADDCLKIVEAAFADDAELEQLPAEKAAVVRALRLAWNPRHGKPGETGVGLGWHIHPDGVTRWHNGQTGGYSSCLFAVPGRRLAVVVLANTATDLTDKLANRITTSLLGGKVEPVQIAEGVAVDAALLAKNVAKYDHTPAFAIQTTKAGDRLFAQATGQGRLELYALSPTRFRCKGVDAEISFVEQNGKVTGLVLHQDGRNTTGRKATGREKERRTVKVAPAVLKTYAGKYEFSPEFAIVVTAQGERLFAQATGQEKLELFAATPVKFFYKAVDAEIGFVKQRGKVIGLILRQNGIDQRARKAD